VGGGRQLIRRITAATPPIKAVIFDAYGTLLKLREIQGDILHQVLRQFGVDADPTPYIELYFQITTRIELYPEVPDALRALEPVRAAIVSNADREHLAAWAFTLPVEFVIVSEAVRAYKPDPLIFHTALRQFGLQPQDVLHVGDSDVDDIEGAKVAGLRVAWVNRTGRARRPGVSAPDFEIRDLKELAALL